MATRQMGRIREVNVRQLWDHEAHDAGAAAEADR